MLRKMIHVLVLLALVSSVASAANLMYQPAYLNHFNNATSWDIDPAGGDYTRDMQPTNWSATVYGAAPVYGAGYLGGAMTDPGSSSGLEYATYDWTGMGWNSSSLVDTDGFSVGVWAKIDLAKIGSPQQIVRVQGSRTNEALLIDYANYHDGNVRFQLWGGADVAGLYRWESGSIWKYDNTIGEDPVSEWLYFAASWKKGDGVGADVIGTYVFDATGQLIASENIVAAGVQNGAFISPKPTAPVAADGEFRLNAGLKIGAYTGDNALAIDEVNIQGFLTYDQIQGQVDLMVAGDDLDIVPEPASMLLLSLGGVAPIKRRKG